MQLGPHLLHDEQHHLRIILRRPNLGDLLDLAVAQPRRYGAADPAVLARLLNLLRELAWCAGLRQAQVIGDQLQRLRATAAAQDFDANERSQLALLAEHVEQAMLGRWQPDQLDRTG